MRTKRSQSTNSRWFSHAAVAASWLGVLLWLVTSSDILAAPPNRTASGAEWPLEKVTLKNGREYRGLVESEDDDRLVFVHVERPAGKPMYLWVHPILRSQIVSRKHLPRGEREQLRRRLEPLLEYKGRARIEAGRMANLKIVADPIDGRTQYHYKGTWFELDSTSDEEMTRRSIVRLEQVFLAYHRILTPRQKPRRPLRILLFGSTDEYRKHLKENDLEITNPAYFSVHDNRIVAGSDITQFGERLADARADMQAVFKEYQNESAQIPQRLQRLSRELKRQGFSSNQIRDEIVATRKRWEDEVESKRQQILASERRNATSFDHFARRMFTRLRHEALHAYVENYVYSHTNRRNRLARWLNEGLAQVFEGGQIDVDTLRIDAPDHKKLRALQADLRGDHPLPLASLLEADHGLFLVSHPGETRASARHYLYSWGLVYYLTFARPGFNGDQLDHLTRRDRPAVERLEQLVGMPLPQFEKQWQDWMLKLSANNGR